MVGKADITPLEPASPGAPSYDTGILMVLLIGDSKLEPLTVNVTTTFVAEDNGVTTTDDDVELVGVAPDIDQLNVGLVTLGYTALKVALGGLKAPPAFCTNVVYPEMSTLGPFEPAAPGSVKTNCTVATPA